MVQTFLSRFGWFISLLLLQVLVFNHIHIFGFATPMPYIYFLLILPGETARWLYVVLGFVMGMLVDLFATTPGVAASSMAAMGLIVPLLLRLFRPTDRDDQHYASEFLHANVACFPNVASTMYPAQPYKPRAQHHANHQH